MSLSMLVDILKIFETLDLCPTWCWVCHYRSKPVCVCGWMNTSNTLKNGYEDLSATEYKERGIISKVILIRKEPLPPSSLRQS